MTLRNLAHRARTQAGAALRRPLRAAVGALAVASALLGLATAPASAATGLTPGTYTYYSFSGSPTLTDVTWSTSVLHDPGYTANVFWSHQFGFNVGDGAYVGMQTNGGSNRTFLFSVWGVSQATAGSSGSWCQSFGGEGTGMSCRMYHDWTAGHTYTFTVAAEGGGWFGATIRDTTAGTSFKLGSILTPASAIATGGMVDWTEYFEWNDARSTCYDQPFSDARFGLPTANGGAVTAAVSGTTNSGNACASMTRTDVVSGGTVQNLSIGNSVRGPITGLAGKCVDPYGGVSNGTNADLYTCSNNWNQGFVRGGDGSLRLPSNYCLTASGTTAGSAVKVNDCAGTGTGGAVTTTTKLWTYNSTTRALVNRAANLCLEVPGSVTTNGTTLTLGTCTGAANQQWTVPAIP